MELFWYERFGDEKKKWERTRTAATSTKMKNARAKRAKLLFSLLNMQICNVLVQFC